MKKHILLIDDDADELTIFVDALRKVNAEDEYLCSFANSSLQAMEMLKAWVPDYIFIDFNIPKMNGLEFIAFVTDQARLRATRCCLYSIHISEEVNEQAAYLGATCIQKEGTIDELAKNLDRLFSE